MRIKQVKQLRDTAGVRFFRIGVFLLILAVLFGAVSNVLVRKSLAKPWDMSVKVGGFYNERENSFDTMFFGSSHMYCSVDPLKLQQETGRKGYILATQEQPLWISYYYMEEALKTQNPDTMVVEVNMVTKKEDFAEEGTNHSALDPIPFSKNKVRMVRASVPWGEQRNYLFSIFKYHGRWEELNLEDFKQSYKKKKDPGRGFVRLEEAHPIIEAEAPDVTGVTEIQQPSEKNMKYLDMIYELTERNDQRLVLLKAPSNPSVEDQQLYNGVWEFAEARNIPYIDYNRGISWANGEKRVFDPAELKLDGQKDYYDQHHLNASGVAKFTPVFGRFLQNL